LHERRFTAALCNHVDGLLTAVFIHIGDDQFRTFPGKRQCGSSSDTRSSACDEGNFAV
jgi:hypothetical protein